MSQHDLPWLGQGRQQPKKETSNMKLNVIPTNEAQNMAAALECDTNRDAELLFRALQHANDRGTTSTHYAELERRWKIKQQKHRAELEKRKVMTPFGMMENHSYQAKGGEA